MAVGEPEFFDSPAAWRSWLEAHHESEDELLVGFWKAGTGEPTISWVESVEEALCFGWIDGVRRRIDDERYSIRFTPRRPRSIWSAVNIAKVAELEAAGRMTDAGRRAFGARTEARSGIYAHEREREHDATLEPEQERRLRENAAAAAFFDAQSPSYRRTAIHWVVSAKRADTRERRLRALIEDSAAGRTVRPLTR